MSEVRLFIANPLIRFIAAMGLLGLILSCMLFDGFATVLALALGAAVYAVAEYAVHRYLLHEFPGFIPALYKGHVDHHRHPQDMKYMFSPVVYDVLMYVVYVVLLWFVAGGRLGVVAAIATGSLLFQLYYQWMHFAAHRPAVPATAWGRWMKKKHLLHHYKDEHAWYGVSHPVLDYAMGTYKETDLPKQMRRSEGNERSNRKGDLAGVGIGGSGQGTGREND